MSELIGDPESATTDSAADAPTPGPAAALDVDRVSFGYPGRRVLDRVSLRVRPGEFVALVGLNGCGKSTLLRLAAGVLRPESGRVSVDGADMARTSRREAARKVALLHQAAPAVPGLTVRQLVRQGRYAARGPLGMLRVGDDEVTVRAMRDVGVDAWADRPVDALSGGERQRVRLALALAQDTPVLLLDEPTTYLDLRHQLEVLQLVGRLRDERRLTVLMVLHDLDLAARFAERLVALRDGHVAAEGPPDSVVTPGLLREVFGIEGRVGRDPERGWPVCYPDRPLRLP
ncbi:ABC transporter ATP-binding protein [Actinomadura rudentiformis]|uniref:ABC transporter ATP-binding protein n=1 Tax=Actinomadura rudentiformis TaxID=359158 RepID=A0A6H9YQK5_9ACTN|nr:ABC transporter ATP-binding protein [Actinomadura rudentiformis]KAB2349707.1 ABC transporter ATP-binding protein [Actinomadura rudentiformis]